MAMTQVLRPNGSWSRHRTRHAQCFFGAIVPAPVEILGPHLAQFDAEAVARRYVDMVARCLAEP